MKYKWNILLFLILPLNGVSQKLFHQDVFYGGVTSAGWSSGAGAWGSGTIEFTIEPGSTIRNAWLFMYRLGKPEPGFFTLNNEPIYHDSLTRLNEVYHFDGGSVDFFYINFRDYVTAGNNTIDVVIHSETSGPELNWQWCNPIIYVEYENPSLDKVSTSLWYNDKDFKGFEEYEFQDMNPIHINNDAGLSLMMDRACFNPNDRTFVTLNGNLLTSHLAGIGGNNTNSSSSCAGVRGHFYYQDATLEGFDGAIANDSMGDNDALADISPYISNNDTGYELELEHIKWPLIDGTWANVITLFPHAYTTPCDTFSTEVAFLDTTICRGDSVVLGVSGGTSYEWLGANISDSSSATPTVFPDSTQLYVAKIENEPGCYRTEQVLVEVNQLPAFSDVAITPTVCGEETGQIEVNVSGSSPFIYDIGGEPQSQPSFPNLALGDYNLTVVDDNDCVNDTLVNVPDSIAVQTNFIADPPSGPEPLSVLFSNTSENATDYEWFIEGEFWDENFNSDALFDSSGVFDVMLVAYNNEPHCADTSIFTIQVKDTLIVRFPNVFTPNNDQVNDVYTIKIRGATHIEGGIFNRWGNEVAKLSKELTPAVQTIPIWNGQVAGNPATDGVYFYRFIIKDVDGEEYEFSGYLHLNR